MSFQITEEGPRTGGDLTFRLVFDRLETHGGVRLTNASVNRRVWRDQDDFQSEIIARVVDGANEAGQLDAAYDILTPPISTFDLSSAGARWSALAEVARPAGALAVDSRVGTRNSELWVGVWVVSVTNPATEADSRDHSRLHDALAAALEETGAAWDQLLSAILQRLGLRLKARLTLRQLTESTAAMAAGYSLRRASGKQPQFLEIDPDWRIPDRTALGRQRAAGSVQQ